MLLMSEDCSILRVGFSLARWEGGSENTALLQDTKEHITFSMLGLHIAHGIRYGLALLHLHSIYDPLCL